METTEVLYIIQWTEPNKAEGGPTVTRHADNLTEAYKIFDRAMQDPEAQRPSLIKQTSVITKERIT